GDDFVAKFKATEYGVKITAVLEARHARAKCDKYTFKLTRFGLPVNELLGARVDHGAFRHRQHLALLERGILLCGMGVCQCARPKKAPADVTTGVAQAIALRLHKPWLQCPGKHVNLPGWHLEFDRGGRARTQFFVGVAHLETGYDRARVLVDVWQHK